MSEGVWSLDLDTGEWVLSEPYASEVARIRRAVTDSFNGRLFEECAKVSVYTAAELEEEYFRMVEERDQYPTDLIASFIVEAMTGQFGK